MLTAHGQEARQAGTERAGAFDRECTPTRRVPVDEPQRVCVAVAARGDGCLKQDSSTDDKHDRERTRIAVRIDTNHVVQPICKHP